jgi:hypothetical protein
LNIAVDDVYSETLANLLMQATKGIFLAKFRMHLDIELADFDSLPHSEFRPLPPQPEIS